MSRGKKKGSNKLSTNYCGSRLLNREEEKRKTNSLCSSCERRRVCHQCVMGLGYMRKSKTAIEAVSKAAGLTRHEDSVVAGNLPVDDLWVQWITFFNQSKLKCLCCTIMQPVYLVRWQDGWQDTTWNQRERHFENNANKREQQGFFLNCNWWWGLGQARHGKSLACCPMLSQSSSNG